MSRSRSKRIENNEVYLFSFSTSFFFCNILDFVCQFQILFFSIIFLIKQNVSLKTRAKELTFYLRAVVSGEKLFTGKSLIPDFKTLALASLIIPNFFEQEFLPTKQCNKNSLCHKTNRNHLIENVYKKKIFNIRLGKMTTYKLSTSISKSK